MILVQYELKYMRDDDFSNTIYNSPRHCILYERICLLVVYLESKEGLKWKESFPALIDYDSKMKHE